VQVRTLAADLSKADSCRKLLQQLKGTPIRVLIANAGGGGGKGLAPYW
jgi:short-subunit dehydrogenase